jgi:hypothetical protein
MTNNKNNSIDNHNIGEISNENDEGNDSDRNILNNYNNITCNNVTNNKRFNDNIDISRTAMYMNFDKSISVVTAIKHGTDFFPNSTNQALL